jgi:hypothetical protein
MTNINGFIFVRVSDYVKPMVIGDRWEKKSKEISYYKGYMTVGKGENYSLCPQLSAVSSFCIRKFDSIYIKCVQHLYLQINLLKN